MAKLAALGEHADQGRASAARYRDHQLTGNFAGRRECHVEPDWLV